MVVLSMADSLRRGAEDFLEAEVRPGRHSQVVWKGEVPETSSKCSGSGILSQPIPQSIAACSIGLFSFQCINWGFWLHVLIKKTLVTCHKCRKNVPNVPGKRSAGSYPCLGSPYNFLYPPFTPPRLWAERLHSFSQADWLGVGNGWSHCRGWLTDIINFFGDGWGGFLGWALWVRPRNKIYNNPSRI